MLTILLAVVRIQSQRQAWTVEDLHEYVQMRLCQFRAFALPCMVFPIGFVVYEHYSLH